MINTNLMYKYVLRTSFQLLVALSHIKIKDSALRCTINFVLKHYTEQYGYCIVEINHDKNFLNN